jgi:ATP/ADP translocase
MVVYGNVSQDAYRRSDIWRCCCKISPTQIPNLGLFIFYRQYPNFLFCFQQQLWKITSARVFFVWVSVFNLFIISVFWSFTADIFSNEQGNRLFGFIAAGGTVGALTGPMKTAIYLARFAAENYPLGLRNLTALAGGNFFSNLLFPTLP